MTTLTADQLEFLERQRIPLSQVLDATGMAAARYKRQMQELGMVVAFGVAPCNSAGHTLRTRYGHCVQCGTHNLAFLRRYDNSGDVYVAKSKSERLVKIGTAEDAEARAVSLNYFGYGGASDWAVHYVERCERTGRVEFLAHQSLRRFCVSRSYEKQGRIVNCNELFSCSVAVAKVAVVRANSKLSEYDEGVT